jgi:hypothetical protein
LTFLFGYGRRKISPFTDYNIITLEAPVYGFDAISAANGWAMAIAGALIVMSGLTVLSFVISQLHKIAERLEKGLGTKSTDQEKTTVKLPEPSPVQHPVFDIEEAREALMPLAADLGEEFELKFLYEIAAANDLPHVHLSIRNLRESGVIIPTGEGLHRWQS